MLERCETIREAELQSMINRQISREAEIETDQILKIMFIIWLTATLIVLIPALIIVAIEYSLWSYIAAGGLSLIIWSIIKPSCRP